MCNIGSSNILIAISHKPIIITTVIAPLNKCLIPVFPDLRYMAPTALLQDPYKAPKKILVSKMDNRNAPVSKKLLSDDASDGIEVANLNSLWCTKEYCNRFGRKGWLSL